ncbi:MAG: hypothetical protein KF886_13525 [Candidatus Hydrogenedentes bacterium]|nr:hypothetical protein [Candidatus Hydrogenedentota bacterium]
MNLLTLIAIGKILVCAAAIGLLIILRIARQHRLPDVDRRAGIALGVLAILSVAFFLDFGYYPKHGRFMNPHGWYHYYLGAKYSAELGYDDLYNATVVANTENNGRLMHDRVRSMRTYAMEPAADIMRDAERYRALFTPERWDAFKKDVAYFQEITIPRRWPGVVHDKGYNATPVWNMFGAWITNATDTAQPFHMRLLLWLDPLLLALMLGAVRSAFGARVMLLVLVYFGAHFAFGMYGVNEIRGALLRWDWLACLGIAICLLRLGHFKSAGALVAVAGMSRLFPLVFLFGMGARFAWDIYTNRRIARHYVEFFWAFAAVAVALVTASVVWDGGLQHWRDFLEKIALHDEDLVSQRTGFKYAFLHAFDGIAGKEAWFGEHQIAWRACQIVGLLLAFFGVRKLEDYEAVAFSYVPMFILSSPTTYYQIALLLPLFLFLPRLDSTVRLIGAAISFGVVIAFHAFNITGFLESQYALSALLSWLLLAYCVYLIGAGLTAARNPAPPATAPATGGDADPAGSE